VGKLVIVEFKAVEKIEPVHEVQLLTHLRLANLWLGLLINFNVPILGMASEGSSMDELTLCPLCLCGGFPAPNLRFSVSNGFLCVSASLRSVFGCALSCCVFGMNELW